MTYSAQAMVMEALEKLGPSRRQDLCVYTQLADCQVHGALVGLANREKVLLRAGKWSIRKPPSCHTGA